MVLLCRKTHENSVCRGELSYKIASMVSLAEVHISIFGKGGVTEKRIGKTCLRKGGKKKG